MLLGSCVLVRRGRGTWARPPVGYIINGTYPQIPELRKDMGIWAKITEYASYRREIEGLTAEVMQANVEIQILKYRLDRIKVEVEMLQHESDNTGRDS